MRNRFLALAFVGLLLAGCDVDFPSLSVSTSSDNSVGAELLMGNPSGATANVADKDNYLLSEPFFALSYNNSKGCPNWVSWHLTRDTLGNMPRPRHFEPDPALPPGFVQVKHDDYTNSGFDRGHMCPNADRNATTEQTSATFLTSNIVPQTHEMNAGAWEALESYCRYLVEKQGKELYIVAGPMGVGGETTSGIKKTIGKNRVVVPRACWKVVMVLDANDNGSDVARVNGNTRLIAVVMPNALNVDSSNWAKYRVSVKEVEQLTGYRFFDRVPTNIIEPLKEYSDNGRIARVPTNRRG